MTTIKYFVWQIYVSTDSFKKDMSFEIISFSSDRKDITYMRRDSWFIDDKTYKNKTTWTQICTTRISTFIKRLKRNEMILKI